MGILREGRNLGDCDAVLAVRGFHGRRHGLPRPLPRVHREYLRGFYLKITTRLDDTRSCVVHFMAAGSGYLRSVDLKIATRLDDTSNSKEAMG